MNEFLVWELHYVSLEMVVKCLCFMQILDFTNAESVKIRSIYHD
ncbi:hypothetical protein BMS3Abin05_00821 [bacterium BMS3Abin05]|nr:hypothetical protein BMS3Abin05_00821 [bacterium BMS3Abin05]GBE28762.1 hypothetical protein BMS3Bbin03_02713 [bacterium BMS3Bbin03]